MIQGRAHDKRRIHADKKRRHVCATRAKTLSTVILRRHRRGGEPKDHDVSARNDIAEGFFRRAGADPRLLGSAMSRGDTLERIPRTNPFPQAIAARLLERRMPIYHRTYSPGELQFITTSTYRRVPVFLSLRFCQLGTGRGQAGGIISCTLHPSCVWTGWIELPLERVPWGHRRPQRTGVCASLPLRTSFPLSNPLLPRPCLLMEVDPCGTATPGCAQARVPVPLFAIELDGGQSRRRGSDPDACRSRTRGIARMRCFKMLAPGYKGTNFAG
jgi:hypothetical protein